MSKFLKREKIQINLTAINLATHLYNNFINMGNLNEDNIFMEAEGEEPEAPKEKAPEPKEKPKEKAPKDPEEETPDPKSEGDEDPFAGGGGDDVGGGDPFSGGGEVDDGGESEEVLEGLPKDEQYYVIILKNMFEKIQKLKEVALRLLNKNDDNDSKIIEKINSLEYIFDRFVEQYEEYENPKTIIIRLQKATNALLIFTNDYLKKGQK